MELFQKPAGVRTRWVTFENPSGATGQGGMANKGAKGHAHESLPAGKSTTLCDIRGAGIIRRMWMTIDNRPTWLLRSLRLDIYWDGAATPAVSCPLGDFFCVPHGRMAVFCNALFSSPEGRSFNCIIPMPFRTGCRVVITNESSKDLGMLFYEIDYEEVDQLDASALYFHTHWRRERPTGLGRDFEILPQVSGKGRFLGCSVGVIASEAYGKGWWGEGEVKIYLDGENPWPTLVGTGAEDYIGTGWGMKTFFTPYQGCSIDDPDRRQWGFYRLHVPDPVYFDTACRVVIQSMGGMRKRDVLQAIARGAEVEPATVAGVNMLDNPARKLTDETFPDDAWCNHYRRDDYCATAYFYLDRPESSLPALAPLEERLADIPEIEDRRRADT
jgi:hypothetical protein